MHSLLCYGILRVPSQKKGNYKHLQKSFCMSIMYVQSYWTVEKIKIKCF